MSGFELNVLTLPSAKSLLPTFLIVYTFVCKGPSIRFPPLSLVVIMAVNVMLGLIGFFMPNISSLVKVIVGILTGVVTSYVIELPDFSSVPPPIPTLSLIPAAPIPVPAGKSTLILSIAPVVEVIKVTS